MPRLAIAAFLLFSTALFLPVTASALTTYTYTGNAFDTFTDQTPPAGSYDNTMFVAGSFTVDDPFQADRPLSNLTPLAYSFNDGRDTLTDLNSTIFLFEVGTDNSGAIDEWRIQINSISSPSTIGQQSKIIFTSTLFDFGALFEVIANDPIIQFGTDQASREDQGGSWTRTISAVPEPTSISLLGFGVVALFLRSRRHK